AASFLKKAKALDVEIILPIDHVVASEFKEDSIPEYIGSVDIPNYKIGMDIGEKAL
ncbi:phosphoglycerate kinase, partial [Pseudomonas aeruginosa]|nr:phosphoglycerate kinase [Pseudomonas aeruginosa]